MGVLRTMTLTVLVVAAAGVAAAVTGRSLRGRRERVPYVRSPRVKPIELRRYESYCEAQIVVRGSYTQAREAGFGVLAYYFVDANAAPGVGTRAPAELPPLVSLAPGPSGWAVSSALPQAWTFELAPPPSDDRVEIGLVTAARWAVRRFSGRVDDEGAEAQAVALERDAGEQGIVLRGAPMLTEFDPPWVLGPWRKNELRWAVRETA